VRYGFHWPAGWQGIGIKRAKALGMSIFRNCRCAQEKILETYTPEVFIA